MFLEAIQIPTNKEPSTGWATPILLQTVTCTVGQVLLQRSNQSGGTGERCSSEG
jgi:hypothetical protein